MPRTYEDLTGQQFGKLTVVKPYPFTRYPLYWECRCECGATVTRRGSELAKAKRRNSVSACPACVRKRHSELRSTHGMSKTPLFAVWRSMKARCLCPTHFAYKRYGGRGITVCQRWQDSFENFLEDMGPAYQAGLVLDRIDNDGPYSPENCRWTTYKVNSKNKKGAYADVDVAALSEATGLGKTTIYWRITQGWPVEMLGIPADRRNSRKEFQQKLVKRPARRKYMTS